MTGVKIAYGQIHSRHGGRQVENVGRASRIEIEHPTKSIFGEDSTSTKSGEGGPIATRDARIDEYGRRVDQLPALRSVRASGLRRERR
jgi:hypothetical protein